MPSKLFSFAHNFLHLVMANQECQGEIIFIADGSSEEWTDEQIPQLFKGSGIRMMFKDEPYSVFASEEKEEVYGVLVYHESGYEEDELGDEKPVLYFSVAVKETCRKQNIATKLIEDFVQSHKRHAILKGEVWNPLLYSTLSKLGFIEEDDLSIYPDRPIKLFTLK
jgi:GNAT superfamily N-acetyltransferase